MRCHPRLLALVLCLAFVAWPLAAQPVRGDCGLNNNGFEGNFPDLSGAGHLYIANGWSLWFQDGPGQKEGLYWRPTYRPEDRSYLGGSRVHGGNTSQKWGTSWATHNAGVYQRVGVPSGSKVTFTAWGRAWSSNGDDVNSSKNEGNYRMSVGIDPTGGTNWSAGSVSWTETRMECLTWIQFSISTQAQGDAVTVFLRGQAEFPVLHNESYWDDACLVVVPPTPRPTNTPRATNTPTDTPTPTETATPTATATPLTSSICVTSFDDTNGNGKRDEGEKLLVGARIAVVDSAQAEVASYTTTGTGEPYCFTGLPAGSYVVREQDPPGFQSTAPNDWGLTVVGGAQVAVDFAHRPAPTATPTPTATNTPTPTPTPKPLPARIVGAVGHGLYSVSGVLLALIAVALVLGARYLRMNG